MREVRIILSAFLLLMVLPLTSAFAGNVVAKVGDVPITSFEVERQTSRIMPFNVTYHGTVTEDKKNEVREKALDELILRAYKVCYAKSLQLEISEERIQEKIDQVKEKLKTPEAFTAAVAEETEAGLRDSIRRGMLAQEAENLAIHSRVNVPEDFVKSYYEENKHTFLMPSQFRASQIVIKVDPAATKDVREEKRKKAEELMKKAKAGEDFYNLAYYNSEDRTSYVGGDMGVFHEGRAAKPIEDALKKLAVDGISDIVETIYGFHVLKLTQVIEPRQLSYEDVSTKIRSMHENKQRTSLYEEWMNELKTVYKVERVND
ncbi:MAG: peptidylprolyl isomerase [Desulfuromonadales bacterium]|nr:peptidylprolyl isomerase [Desulfuromonadales bacterium]